MKKLVNLGILLSFFSLANAQEQCGTDQLLVRNPFLLETYNSRVACDVPEINLDTAQVLIIPVVFHILHLLYLILTQIFLQLHKIHLSALVNLLINNFL